MNETTGASLGTVELAKTGTSGNDQLWVTPGGNSRLDRLGACRRPASPRRRLGSQLRLRPALYGVLRRGSNGRGRPHPRAGARAAPTVRNAWLLPGSCLPDAYFATERLERRGSRPRSISGDTSSDRHRGDREGMGGSRRQRSVPADAGRHDRSRHLDNPRRLAARRKRAAHGRSRMGLAADRGDVEREDLHDQEKQPVQGRGDVRSRAASVRRRRRVGTLAARPGVREQRLTSGSNSFQIGTTPTLGISIAVSGSLKVQSLASDPVIELRVTGARPIGRLRSPAPNLADEIEQGCGPAYKINPASGLPGLQPALVVARALGVRKTRTGGAGQVEKG